MTTQKLNNELEELKTSSERYYKELETKFNEALTDGGAEEIKRLQKELKKQRMNLIITMIIIIVSVKNLINLEKKKKFFYDDDPMI